MLQSSNLLLKDVTGVCLKTKNHTTVCNCSTSLVLYVGKLTALCNCGM